jgi:type IV pilus assembly protein PilV
MSRGFSLIEALVALTVLSVGLLGAAGMLLGGLRDQSQALRHGAATALVADIANRILANVTARDAYDSRSEAVEASDCGEAAPCDAAALAARDRAFFVSAARALLPGQEPSPQISFEPAIGPAAPDRYAISLRWRDPRDPDTTDESTLIVLAQPVAGAP